MTKNKKMKSNKNCIRDALTNKRIGNKEVIVVDNAIDWVKKQGYLVVKPTLKEIVSSITYISLFFFLSFIILILIPMTSAVVLDTQNVSGQQYPDILIKNGGSVVATMKLIENTNNCLTDCYAIINISSNISAILPYNSFDFKTVGNINKTIPYSVYYLNYSKINVTTNLFNCLTPVYVSGSPNCSSWSLTPTLKTIDNSYWIKYNGQTLNAGNYTFKLMATKNINDNIDWGFGYQGILPDDIRKYWAWWNTTYIYKTTINSTTGNIINLSYITNSASNFSDIRFISKDEKNELPNYEQVINNSVSSIFHIKNLSEVGFIYYGINNIKPTSSLTSVYPNLTLYYPMDYNFFDVAGGNNISSYGNSFSIGKIFRGYNVASVESSGLTTNYALPNKFTLCYWINLTGTPTAGNILMGTGTGSNGDFYINFAGSGDQYFQMKTTTDYLKIDFISYNTWMHVCWSWNGSVMNGYRNGQSFVNQTFAWIGANSDTLQLFAIGGTFKTANYVIDDLRVYNKPLNALEVNDLYNNYLFSTYLLGTQQTNDNETAENGTTFHDITTPDGQSYIPLHNWTFSVDINNSNGSVILNIANVNYTMISVADTDNDKYQTTEPFNLDTNNYNVTFITWSNSPPHRRNQTSVFVNITKMALTFNISYSPNLTINNGTQTTITGYEINSNLCYVCFLFRDNSLVSNPDTSVLGIGSHIYIFNITNLSNYYYSQANITINVNKAVMNLSIHGLGTLINGIQSNITGSGCPITSNCILYRNNIVVNNSDINIFPIGIYNYTYNTTGDATYSPASISGQLIITMPSGINTFLVLLTYDFTTQTNVLIFIFAVLMTIGIFVYINWDLACVLFIIEGIILLANLSNKFIGLIFIFGSVVALLMPRDKV